MDKQQISQALDDMGRLAGEMDDYARSVAAARKAFETCWQAIRAGVTTEQRRVIDSYRGDSVEGLVGALDAARDGHVAPTKIVDGVRQRLDKVRKYLEA